MKYFKSFTTASEHPESLGYKFRVRRFADFEQLFYSYFNKNEPVRILDLGGTEYFWRNHDFLDNPNISITLLNLQSEPVSLPRVESTKGDATNLSQYSDHSFDLIFSNSVIEHLHTKEKQQRMASEARRVGRKYFIQTPNKNFFLEPHYALPLFQFLPDGLAYWILTKTKLSRWKKWRPEDARQYLNEIRLLTEQEMIELFPAGKIYYEKFAGFTKSFSAHNF